MPTAPDAVKRLVDRFDAQKDHVTHPDYNETQLRIDYVNPLFAALGWDIDNTQGFAEQYREVVHEDRIRVPGAGGGSKAPDYSFRIGGVRKFFLEAKKPHVSISKNPEPAYQLRRYAWSAKLPVSVLTDFEELAIYDTRQRPRQLDKPSAARREYITYDKYLDRWDFIEGTFSKRAVLTGDFDRYCATAKGRGAEEFDDAFLEEIEGWRKKFAQNLALRNDGANGTPNLDQPALNFAVQRIIDRVIFLRICEDRGIEPPRQLQSLLSGDNTYKRLVTLFRKADDRYNSGIFHFAPEKGRDESPDTLTPDLDVDDKTLKDILKRLYYPESPYEFSVVSADILGSVYERFLGKVITLSDAHRAKVEDKPEVRKAGGVYYTPTYIVDYIVQHTLGALLPMPAAPTGVIASATSSKTPVSERSEDPDKSSLTSDLRPLTSPPPTPKDAAKLKILDPACGSGSFLLGAYQYLLDWHLQYYLHNDPDQHAASKKAPIRPYAHDGHLTYRLTIQTRKQILLDNIHGVDLDPQAVEVTKLSLLLKCLEGETAETLDPLLSLFRERALPDLGHNIQCGNSLIGTDIMTTDAWSKMTGEEKSRTNPFDYDRSFPQVFNAAKKPVTRASERAQTACQGFDLVIGNPPYIRVSNIDERIRPILYERYSLNHRFDVYVAFVEQGFRLLNSNGKLGFILPNKFFVADYGAPIRRLLSENLAIDSIMDFGDTQVFRDATTYTCILILSRNRHENIDYGCATTSPTAVSMAESRRYHVPARQLGEGPWTFADPESAAILGKLEDLPALGSLFDIQHGLQTGLDSFFLLQLVSQSGDRCLVTSELDPEPFEIEIAATRPVVKGLVDLTRYVLRNTTRRVLFPYALQDSRVMPAPEAELRQRFPQAWAYIKRHEKVLRDRGASVWYAYRRRNYDLRDHLPRFLVPSIATRSSFVYDPTGTVHFVGSGGGGGGGYGLNFHDGIIGDPRFYLGILNSSMIDWIAKQSNSRFGHGYYSFNRQFIEPLKVPAFNPSNRDHARLPQMVDTILGLHRQLPAAPTPHAADALRRQIDATDRQIDLLVYRLYGLTDAEIRTVESATAPAPAAAAD